MNNFATVFSRALHGVRAPSVLVEAHLFNGIPAFNLVGLAETAVKESRDRVKSALMNTHFEFPTRKITVNLAPADVPKEGSKFDLPIAISILVASHQLPAQLNEYELVGELGLSGELRPINGILPIALACKKANKILILPFDNAEEAALVEDLTIFPAKHLLEVCSHIAKQNLIFPYTQKNKPFNLSYSIDMQEVKGQIKARRALEVAAAGGHSLLFEGPPGTGKTMLASRLPTILPPMTIEESLEAAAITSISHLGFRRSQWGLRSFRTPHHSASSVALVGGGNPPRPGEISLAHLGVLFLDELPEFSRHVLEALREPIESGSVTISRAARQCEFPAKFQLIAAMNPCPCGYYGDLEKNCRCTPDQIKRYRHKISGPLLDRIDIHVQVPRLATDIITEQSTSPLSETSELIRTRVCHARDRQIARSGLPNANLPIKTLFAICSLDKDNTLFMQQVIKKLKLSARAYHRILRVARTIADLANSEEIKQTHLAEAASFRRLELDE